MYTVLSIPSALKVRWGRRCRQGCDLSAAVKISRSKGEKPTGDGAEAGLALKLGAAAEGVEEGGRT